MPVDWHSEMGLAVSLASFVRKRSAKTVDLPSLFRTHLMVSSMADGWLVKSSI